MHQRKYQTAGIEPGPGTKLLIMLHGRGANAEDIMGLSRYLDVSDFSIIAPEATNHTWYPYSFLSPKSANEPWLSSALDLINSIVEELLAKGVTRESIYFLGFSQGACLTLEYVSRNATKYGGIVAFTGGLIGDKIEPENYKGNFKGTPVFIGTSDPDPHVPVERVNQTTEILRSLNAAVTSKIYKAMGHTINQDEIEQANRLVFNRNED
jgi:phospholipase/carboxylesterase